MQTDGYNVYDDFESMEGITIYGCWTHARRKFVESLDEDNVKATQALMYINKLYHVENTNKELQLCHDEIKTRRQKESYPIIREFEKWLEDTWNKALRTSRDVVYMTFIIFYINVIMLQILIVVLLVLKILNGIY